MAQLYDAVEHRRSIYSLGDTSPISKDEILRLVEHSVKYAPSAFNSQSARVVVLFGEEHKALWDIVLEALRGVTPPGKFPETEEKINTCFKAGFGTVLFFEDQATVTGLQEKFALYKDNFPVWSLQSSGMLQYIIWTSLEEKGLGASLQHYNPLIDDKVKERWNLPESWKLWSQMPFGSVLAPADEKTFLPLEERIRVFGK